MHQMMLKKPTTCKCGGGFRANGKRWVKLDCKGNSAQLKCLECGWKWWSHRKYALGLRQHKESSRSGMTDEHILKRLQDGSLRVCTQNAIVESLVHGCFKRVRIIERESNGSTYSFVEVGYKKLKKKIALHRLVWMSHHMQVVPAGVDVDHIHGKQAGNGIENLRLLDSHTNRSRGKPAIDIDRLCLF